MKDPLELAGAKGNVGMNPGIPLKTNTRDGLQNSFQVSFPEHQQESVHIHRGWSWVGESARCALGRRRQFSGPGASRRFGGFWRGEIKG